MRPAMALIPVLLLAGCTSISSGGTSSPGVVITAFAPDVTEVFESEPVQLDIRIENQGPATSGKGSVQILGLDNWLLAGAFAKQETKQQGSFCTFPSLAGATPSTSGQSKACSFTYTAPSVPPGTGQRFTATARLTYAYTTETIQSITLAPRNELKRLASSSGSLATSSTSTAGPLSVSLAIPGPIKLVEGDRTVFFPVQITIANTGSGTVCADFTQGCTAPVDVNKVTLKLSGDGIAFTECDSIQLLTLYQGRSATVTCTGIFSGADKLSTAIQKTITARADYVYIQDADTAVTVRWREQVGS